MSQKMNCCATTQPQLTWVATMYAHFWTGGIWTEEKIGERGGEGGDERERVTRGRVHPAEASAAASALAPAARLLRLPGVQLQHRDREARERALEEHRRSDHALLLEAHLQSEKGGWVRRGCVSKAEGRARIRKPALKSCIFPHVSCGMSCGAAAAPRGTQQ